MVMANLAHDALHHLLEDLRAHAITVAAKKTHLDGIGKELDVVE